MRDRTLGHFEILAKLGEGGMGEVYRARDTKLGRDVALKVLHRGPADDPARLDRFKLEARALAALDHPAIVTVFSAEEADGVHFLTMQLARGTTVDRLIEPRGLPVDRLLDIAIPLTDGIAAAHERGIVHRDLKPSNVMWSDDGQVKILDFGLAKLASVLNPDSDEDESTLLATREGSILGTIPYMSPEQLCGRPVDARSDVFSLGVLLYELATGHRPFTGDQPGVVVAAILEARPPSLLEARPDLPAALGRIVERCLAKDPDLRDISAREVQRELARLRAVSGGSPPSGGIGPSGGQSASRPSVAILPFVAMSPDPEDDYLADGIVDELTNALGRLPDLRVAARTSAFSFKGRNEDLRTIGEKLGVGTVLEGSLRRAGDRLRVAAQLVDVESGFHLWSERYDRRMADVFEIQSQIAGSIARRLKVTLIGEQQAPTFRHGTDDVDAFELFAKGRALLAQRTQDEMRRAAAYLRSAVERDPGYGAAWAELGSALLLLADYGFAEYASVEERIEAAAQQALTLDPDLAETHVLSALLHYRRREGQPAIEHFRRAIELRPSHAEAYNLLSWLQLCLGRIDEALVAARRAVELDPLAPEMLNHIGLTLLASGDVAGAVRELERSVEVQPEFTTSRFYQAVARFHAGELAETVALLDQLSVPWAPAGPRTIQAFARVVQGELDAARRTAEELDAAEELDHSGLIYATLGELDRAFEAFDRVRSWSYWAMLVIRNFFPEHLGPLRSDPRFADLIARLDEDWGFGVVAEEQAGDNRSTGAGAAP